MESEIENEVVCGCFVWLVIFAFYIMLGASSVNWFLQFFLQKSIPIWGAAIIGLLAGVVTIPASIVVYLLHIFGVM